MAVEAFVCLFFFVADAIAGVIVDVFIIRSGERKWGRTTVSRATELS
jgi:hypothetical protein